MRTTKTIFATMTTALLLSTAAQAGQLELGEGFFATAVNGNKVSVHADSVTLGSGKQVVTVRYEENVIHSREQNKFTVSKPIHLIFDANQGAYQINKTDSGIVITQNNRPVKANIVSGDQALNLAL
ncbi:DUF2057 family protein [Ferrimonas pelagia]|uniref:Uncharacterized protein n=1 Tax=Ferrimonas pelagia TaxID=1177826 RepID=A0ABP9EUU8_9GAMM